MLRELGTQRHAHHLFLARFPFLLLDILDALFDTLGRLGGLCLHDLLKGDLVSKLTRLLCHHVVLNGGILDAVNQRGHYLFIAEHTRIALGLVRGHEEHRRRTLGLRLGLELACGFLDYHRLLALLRRLGSLLGRLLLHRLHHRNRDFLDGLRLATRTTEHEGAMQETERLLLGAQTNLGLLAVELAEHFGVHEGESGFTQDLSDLVKRDQELLRGHLKALEQNANPHSELVLPALSILVLLRELAVDLATRTENLTLLTEKHGLYSLPIQAGSEEDVSRDVLGKHTERVLRITCLVNGELATHSILILQSGELLEVGRRTRLFPAQDLEVGMIVLREGLRHVRGNEEDRRHLRALGALLQNTRTGSLTRRIQIAFVQVKSHHARRLGVDPLVEIPRTTHREFQESASGNHTLLVQAILDAIVESVHILENAVTRIQVVAVVEFILEGIIRRIAGEMREHGFRHRHVNARPDVVCNGSVIAVLSLLENSVFVGFVLACAHDLPAHVFRILAALNDRVVLHTFLLDVLHHTPGVDRNVHNLRVGLARRRRLEWAGHAITNLGETREIGRKLKRRLFTCKLLARIHEIRTSGARDLERALASLLAKDGILRRALVDTKQEVDGVLVRRLPLLDTEPSVSATLAQRSQRRVTRREDQTVGRLLKLGVQNARNRGFHCSSIARKEELGLNLRGFAARRHELGTQILHKELGVTETARIERIRIAAEKRQSANVLALVAVDIEDAELVEVGQELTVNGGAHVVILERHDSGP